MGAAHTSRGEHELQRRLGTAERAAAFYDRQVVDRLNPRMCAFISRQEMAWVATAGASGACDCSFRAGPPGFVRVLDDQTLLYPEFAGNGVMASLGNLQENPGVSILFVDFLDSRVGLHVNGTARVMEKKALLIRRGLPPDVAKAIRSSSAGPPPERWVLIRVSEAYIHCSRHIPQLQKVGPPVPWSPSPAACKTAGYFRKRR